MGHKGPARRTAPWVARVQVQLASGSAPHLRAGGAREMNSPAAVQHAWKVLACAAALQLLTLPSACPRPPTGRVRVSGSGIDLANGAIVHSKAATATGSIEHSTETVELSGDLHGRVLCQVTTVVDSARGTLVNTGQQVYSGTIAGSQPVMLHDSKIPFRGESCNRGGPWLGLSCRPYCRSEGHVHAAGGGYRQEPRRQPDLQLHRGLCLR